MPRKQSMRHIAFDLTRRSHEIGPGQRKSTASPYVSKYGPHQGKRECARRRNKSG